MKGSGDAARKSACFQCTRTRSESCLIKRLKERRGVETPSRLLKTLLLKETIYAHRTAL